MTDPAAPATPGAPATPATAGDADASDRVADVERDAGDEHAGDEHAGDEHAGDEHAGDQHAGDQHAGDQHAGDEHAGWQVSTPVFEGPFDLLLHLILRQEVDLWEVSLSTIVDAYLAELARLQEDARHLDLEVATEFLLIAATLVELKARRLLPGERDGELDEELARFEERDYLLARLLECKTFQDAARVLEERIATGSRRFGRTAGPEEPFRSLAPDPLATVSLDAFATAARRALAPREEPEVRTDHVAPIRVSVREAVETVLALLPDAGRVTFRELATGVGRRLDVVVRFLAVLELFKQGMVDLEQPDSFAELVVRPLAPGERAEVDLSALDDWDETGPTHEAPDAPGAPVGASDHRERR